MLWVSSTVITSLLGACSPFEVRFLPPGFSDLKTPIVGFTKHVNHGAELSHLPQDHSLGVVSGLCGLCLVVQWRIFRSSRGTSAVWTSLSKPSQWSALRLSRTPSSGRRRIFSPSRLATSSPSWFVTQLSVFSF